MLRGKLKQNKELSSEVRILTFYSVVREGFSEGDTSADT